VNDSYDFAADFRDRLRTQAAIRSPLAQAKLSQVDLRDRRIEGLWPPVYVDRYWPGWLCWLLGHEPIVPGENPARDDRRCLCGAGVVGRHAYIVRWQNHPGARRWGQFLTRLWRVLP